MLACLVLKDNKDTLMYATELLAGHMREVARVNKMNKLAKEMVDAKVDCRFEREQSDIVVHEIKKSKG